MLHYEANYYVGFIDERCRDCSEGSPCWTFCSAHAKVGEVDTAAGVQGATGSMAFNYPNMIEYTDML